MVMSFDTAFQLIYDILYFLSLIRVVICLDNENNTKAIHIQPKAIICGVPKLSPKQKIAKKKPIVGDRYGKNPSTLSGNKRAPQEKRIRGTDVVRPEQTSSRPVVVMLSIKDHDVVSTVSTYHRAIGVISHASMAILENG